MSYPILYSSTETTFDSNGIGVLSDALSCNVTEERNGSFELQMKYPIDGIHYSDIQDRCLIMAKPNPVDDAQPFRVYRSTKPLNGIVTFYARHISYDLLGVPVSPFTAHSVNEALNSLKRNAVTPVPYTFWTDKSNAATMSPKVPASLRSLLGGRAGSVLDVYGGEYKFDRFTVRLYGERWQDRGVTIRYGKNLLDLEQERNCADVYTGLYPYWTDMDGNNLVELPEKIVNASGTYDFTNILTIDFSDQWEEAPTEEQLRERAEKYISSNRIGVPKVSLTVSHAMLEQTEEYKGMALLERIDLCDVCSIEFPRLGVSASAKANKTEFNVLLDRYESVSFGDVRNTLITTTQGNSEGIKQATETGKSLVASAMEKMNEIVQKSSGLYTTEEKQSDGSVIYYYHDKPALEESKNVIKFTAEAIGLSTDGGESYPFGFTVTGDMVANILSAIGINANWIKVGDINLQFLKILGTITGIMEGYGATKTGRTTKGIVVYGNDVDADGNANPPYIIVTDSGIRGQTDADHDFNMAGGAFEVNGSITTRSDEAGGGNVNAAGHVSANDYYALNGEYAIRYNKSEDDEKGQLWIGNNSSKNVFLQGHPIYINEPGQQTFMRGNVEFTDRLYLSDGKHRRISIGWTTSGKPTIAFYDSENKYIGGIFEDGSGRLCLELSDENGISRNKISVSTNNHANQLFNDSTGQWNGQIYESNGLTIAVPQSKYLNLGTTGGRVTIGSENGINTINGDIFSHGHLNITNAEGSLIDISSGVWKMVTTVDGESVYAWTYKARE